jgi:hypothetical protein
MSNKSKQRARALKAKSGLSYQAAHNRLRRPVPEFAGFTDGERLFLRPFSAVASGHDDTTLPIRSEIRRGKYAIHLLGQVIDVDAVEILRDKRGAVAVVRPQEFVLRDGYVMEIDVEPDEPLAEGVEPHPGAMIRVYREGRQRPAVRQAVEERLRSAILAMPMEESYALYFEGDGTPEGDSYTTDHRVVTGAADARQPEPLLTVQQLGWALGELPSLLEAGSEITVDATSLRLRNLKVGPADPVPTVGTDCTTWRAAKDGWSARIRLHLFSHEVVAAGDIHALAEVVGRGLDCTVTVHGYADDVADVMVFVAPPFPRRGRYPRPRPDWSAMASGNSVAVNGGEQRPRVVEHVTAIPSPSPGIAPTIVRSNGKLFLKPGSADSVRGGTAWKFLDREGRNLKEFFVLPVGSTTIMFDIQVVVGGRLTSNELQLVEDEMRERMPGREFAWARHEITTPR